ncbi:MAG TPA: cell division protein FtsQ/DivIB [Malonomonas sp.]
MRDLKRQPQAKSKVRKNKAKGVKRPLKLRKLLHRMLRICVASCSGALLVVGSFLAVQLLMASDMFRIDQIAVNGGQKLSEQQLIDLSDITAGQNTFELDLDLIGRKIAENSWVKEARVERIFPREVVISVVERTPVAIINLGYLYYLDRDGVVFKVLDAADKLDFPIITGFDYQKVEQRDPQVAADLQRIVALLADLQGRELFSLDQISEIHRNPSGSLALFTLDAGVKIRLGREDFARKIDRLERIYTQLKPRLPILDYIDLNVDEKVIVRIERPASAARG